MCLSQRLYTKSCINMTKKLTINLPSWVADLPERNGLLMDLLLSTALLKVSTYRQHVASFQQRYGMNFKQFEREVLSSHKEKYTAWDDYVIWKGYQEAFNLWERRYRETAACTKS